MSTLVLIGAESAEYGEQLQNLFADKRDIRCITLYGDGPAILAAVRDKRPDILLLDMMLTRLDGLAVLREVMAGKLTKQPKVILMTSFINDRISAEAAALGADYLLLKPFEAAVLTERVEELAGGNVLPINQTLALDGQIILD